jgi:hypothetical protein
MQSASLRTSGFSRILKEWPILVTVVAASCLVVGAASLFLIRAGKRNKREKVLRATPDGQRKFFDMLFKQAFRPAQPDLFWLRKLRGFGLPRQTRPPTEAA